MRIKHFFGLAVIAAMTASCSSNEDLGTAGPGTGTNEVGVGYATFTINLPTTRGTRADGDLEFNAGDAKEYNVNDVTLLIFQKETGATSEDEYKFVEQANLGTMAPWIKDNGTNGVTTAATITATLSSIDLTSDYYALAILNNKDDEGNNKVTLPTTGDTYGTWNVAGKAAGKFTDTSKGFYMANAPVFSEGEPTSLVKVEGVYTTKQKAESSKATSIHVERGLAKVTLASSKFPETLTPTGTKYNKDKVDITAWNLDVTNKSTFPIHKTAGLTKNFATIWNNTAPTTGASVTRFVDGSNPVFKRVYWGVDPNYSTDLSDEAACRGAFNILDANATIDGVANKPQYCLENTFDIEHMKQGQTTRVVFKATYTPNGFTKGDTFYKIGNSTDLWKKADLEAQIKAKAAEVLGVAETEIIVDLEANNLNEAGTRLLTVDNVKIKDSTTAGSHAVSQDNIDDINAKLGLKKAGTDPIVGIATYKSGESYYIARIKHFGALTPWAEGQDTYGTNNEENNTKYLGRYGVLRNNWYELTVGSVSGLGTPDVPTIKPDVPDDENYRYISVSVKILDWAKRSSTVDL